MSNSKRPIYFTVSVILVFLMAFLLPVQVFAVAMPEIISGTSEPSDGIEISNIVAELKDKRDEYSKQFRLEDGSFLAVSYENPIHYKDEEGNWINYNNSLVDGADANATPDEVNIDEYTNKSSDFDVKYSKKTKDNNMVKVKANDYMVSWGYKGINKVEATVVSNDEKLEGNEKYTSLKNLTSEIIYENAYNNVDIQYITNTVGVKENIILKDKNTPNEFTVQYKFNKLTAKQVNDRTIELVDKSGNVVYSIEAPYMVDAEGKSSTQLSLFIEEQKNGKLILKISADKDFLNNCVYPVTIDPTFNTTQKWQQSECTYTNSASKNTAYGYGSTTGYTGTVYAGTFGSGMYRSFIKMKALPSLSKGDMIVDAKLNLHLYQNGFYKDMYVNAYYISSSWDQSKLTWNNMPSFESNVVDYEKFVKNDSQVWHDWDVTTCVKRWYNGETNNGIMLKVPDESSEVQCASFYSSNYPSSSTPRPLFSITYRNNKGLEDYWTYSSFSVGTAGTAYINDYSGNLVFVTSDAATASGYGPASVQHVYNGYMAGEKYNKTKPYVGRGWRLNVQQTLFETTGDIRANYPYVYTDEDGTEHYFYKKESKYLDEDGLGLELKIGSSTNEYYTISDDKNNRIVFTKSGLLSYTKDSNNNKITINYGSDTPPIINSITDASGNKITLQTTAGSATGYLRYIKDPAGRTTEFNCDSDGLLTTIKRPNGKTVTFTYDSDKCLSTVTDVDGYKVTFTYTSAESGKKVSAIKENGKSGTAGQKITFDRTKYNTTVINSYGADGISGTNDDVTTTYQFDQYGRTKTVKSKATDRDLGASVYEYTAGVKNSTASNIKQLNRVSSEYSTGSNPVNLIKNSNLESTSNWTSAQWCGTNTFTASAVTTQRYFGQKSLRINVTSYTDDSRGRVYQDVSNSVLVPGTTYTLSGYIKTTGVTNGSTNAGAVLCAESFNSDGTSNTFYSDFVYGNTDTTIDNGWQRVSVTFKVPEKSNKTRINLALRKSTGNAYFDGIQLEQYSNANNVNLLENAGLENYSSNGLPTSWSDEYSNLDTSTDKATTAHHHQGESSFRIKGENNLTKGIMQTVNVSGSENDTYIVSGWAKANAAPKDSEDLRKFKISIKVTYTDNASVWKSPAEFNYSVSGWQYTSATFNLSDGVKSTTKTPSSITVCLRYNNQANYVYFDNICLIKDNSQSYTYNSDGKLVSVTSNSEEKSKMEYTNSDLTKSIDAKGYSYTYDYDDKHNMIQANSQKGVSYNYEYNSKGLATSLTVHGSDSNVALLSSVSYNSNGLLTSSTDVNGAQTQYSYNNQTGTLSSVTDTTGTTSYTYDSNTDVLKSVTKQSSTVNYYYSDDSKYLTKISRNGTDYNITYDQYGNKTNSKVGTQSLASYSYNSNNGALIGTTYGTGQTVNYAYDQYGNESTRKYNGTTAFSWRADRSGNVTREEDSINKRQIDYTWDTTGRLVRKSAKDTTKANNQNGNLFNIGYGYDLNNNITSLVYRMPQRGIVSTYTYGKDNLLTKFDINTNRSVSYTYDSINRLTKASVSTDSPINMQYYYIGGTGYTTNRIGKEIIGDATYKYSYDSVGNITQISQVLSNNTEKVLYKYTYDKLNELTKVIDYNNYIISEFKYDNYGNLLKADETKYNTDGIPIKSNYKRYTYGDSNWKDKLTVFNGQTITYDAIGNPLSYRDGIKMTWKNGRQLSTLQNSGNSISYSYDSNNVRVSKTVNGTKYTYVYENGLLMYESRGNAKYYYSYDANGMLYSVKYTLTDSSDLLTYYYSHNFRGDIIGIYNGAGQLKAKYEYDAWGNILSIKDINDNDITAANHIGNLNPFRYRGYYYDSESGLYYLMSRYYDPVTHRFVNADGYFQSGGDIFDTNMSSYCSNNPIMRTDPSGAFWVTAVVTVICIGTAVILSGCSSGGASNSTKSTTTSTSPTPKTSTPKATPKKSSSTTKKASKNLVSFIKNYEGFYGKAYDDGWGNITIGYGHVVKTTENLTEITEAEATALLLEDLAIHEDAVNKYSSSLGVEWDQQEFDAFVDLSFNSGRGMNIAMDDIINGMDPYTAFTRDERYLGLFRRRNDEANIFLHGIYSRTYPNFPN